MNKYSAAEIQVLKDQINSIDGVPTGRPNKFDFSVPFTLAQFIQAHELGDIHDPRVTKPVVKALIEKGYSLRVVKRKRVWSKWPSFKPFVMPYIP